MQKKHSGKSMDELSKALKESKSHEESISISKAMFQLAANREPDVRFLYPDDGATVQFKPSGGNINE